MRVALILCDESVLRLLFRLRLVNRTNLLSLSLTPEALEPERVFGLDLALLRTGPSELGRSFG